MDPGSVDPESLIPHRESLIGDPGSQSLIRDRDPGMRVEHQAQQRATALHPYFQRGYGHPELRRGLALGLALEVARHEGTTIPLG